MKIIKINPNENGSRPALQDWHKSSVPEGYAWCPDEFVATFYSTSPSGFVDIVINDNMVIDMMVNQEAVNEYINTIKQDNISTDIDPTPSLNDRVATLEEALSMILEGVTE